MKKFLNRTCSVFLLLMAFILTMPFEARAEDPTPIIFPVDKGKKGDDDDKGHRAPSRPIICSISKSNGLQGIEKSEIIEYEIWDIEFNIPIITFANEADFIEYLYSIPGTYQIRIETNDYFYIGILSIQ